MAKVYEFRCPVHGFIEVDDWEREIINQPAFQRLRRIRQLGGTDYIYPGAIHTRFEHSLGVMHIATKMYEALVAHSADVLKSEFKYNDDGLRRDRRLVRLAALLHDVGHGPFSHVAEGLLPSRGAGKSFRHEDYSSAIIRHILRDTIENHAENGNYGIKADEVADFLDGSVNVPKLLFWREVITGQMDADRMDYLLRDSLHLGVRYGTYDLDRVINTVCAVPNTQDHSESPTPRVGVTEGGWHAAESLVLARYYMFTQVYFHKTRVAYDHHIGEALRKVLPKGKFPKPQEESIKKYLKWDDWRVLSYIVNRKAGEHGKRLLQRNHYRMVYSTPETPSQKDLEEFEKVKKKLGSLVAHIGEAEKSWYSVGAPEIYVLMDDSKRKPLSNLSYPISNMKPSRQQLLYVKPEDLQKARTKLEASS